MRKNILYIFFITVTLFLSGCGSNSMPDRSIGDLIGIKVLDAKASPLHIEADKSFETSISIDKLESSDVGITLKNFSFSVTGCTLDGDVVFVPNELKLNGGKGTSGTVRISGKVLNDCTPTEYTLGADKIITVGGKSLPVNGETLLTVLLDQNGNPISSVSTGGNSSTGTGTGGGSTSGGSSAVLHFANPTSITVTSSSDKKTISVDLLDKDNVGVAGKKVKITSLPIRFGSITPAESTTNSAGRAEFTYNAPENIAAVSGQSATVRMIYTDDNGTSIYATAAITIVATLPYQLTNETSPVKVHADGEEKEISAVVVDQNGIGVEGKDVSISVLPDNKYGAIISAATTATDSSGKAKFTYKAPQDVSLVDGEETFVYLSMSENGVTLRKQVRLIFNKIDQNETLPTVVVSNNYKHIRITQNNQNVQISVQIFEQGTNTPYTQGNVKVSLPNSVLSGTDVGHFSAYTQPVGANGIATFSYSAPQDIKALVDQNITAFEFKFFHESNPTQQDTAVVELDPQSDYIPTDYVLSTSSGDGSQAMGLNQQKTFTLYLKDDQGTLVDSSQITKITLLTQNAQVGKLIDASTNAGNEVETLVFTGSDAENSKSFSVKTSTLSGLLPILMRVEFNDANGESKVIEQIMNVVVMSGPPTALSIVYTGVEHNGTAGKYIEKFAVTVTDQYNNPVNTRPYIATGAIVEYAVDGSSPTGQRTTTSPRLWHGKNDVHGTLEPIGGDKAQLTTTVDAFNHIDLANDKLVLFGSGFVYEALGKWDVGSAQPQSLQLIDDYFGSPRSGIYYAVGHNNRQDLCSADGTEYVGNMKATNIQLDSTGHALLEFEYDYHLTGKDIMVWVNLEGFQADNNTTGRIGEAKKFTLRGAGFVSPEAYTIAAGAKNVIHRFTVGHKKVSEWYRNGHFGFNYTGCQVDSVIDWSNFHDARDCNNQVGYVDLNISNPTTADCVIQLDDDSIAVSAEFGGVNSY